MHLPARLGTILPTLRLLALAACAALPASLLRAEQNVGVAVGTTGLSPAPVGGKSLTEYDRDLDATPGAFTVDLRSYFTIPGLLGGGRELVQFKTSLGIINAEFLADGTDEGPADDDPHATVANFKSYLATDATSAADKLKTYDGTFIHRAAENRDILGQYVGEFVIQGGGYRVDSDLSALPKKAPVVNEFKYANTRGTLAMAKVGGQPNSATSEWFFNVVDNSETLGTDNNSGFTVFARVLGKGMDVADAIADLPVYSLGDAFDELPLRDVQPGQTQLFFANLVAVDSVRIVPLQPPSSGSGASVLTYTVSSDNPAVATATVANGVLSVKPGKVGGRAILTVRAAEGGGAFVDSPLTVVRAGPPLILKKLPATSTFALGGTATLTASITGWPLPTVQWQHREPGGVWMDIDPASTTDVFTGADSTALVIKLDDASAAATNTALVQNGDQFRYILTQTAGATTRTVTSTPTTLRVTTALAFSAPLAATTTAALGSTVTLSAPATSATFPAVTYKWQIKAPGASTWSDLVNSATGAVTPYSGVTTATLTVALTGTGPAALAARDLDRSQFRCVITNSLGTLEGRPTTLRVTTLPLGFSSQPPALVTGILGANATISVTALPAAGNTPRTYQWQRKAAGASATAPWENLVNSTTEAPTRYTGATSATLTISLAGTDDATRQAALALNDDQYRCVVSNVLGSAPSNPASLRVLAGRPSLVTNEDIALPGLSALAGREFASTGLPKGLALSPDGHITGVTTARPGVYRVGVVIREDGAVTGTRTYYLEVLGLSGNNAGGFEALLSATDQPPAAKLSLTVSATGAFTGTLVTSAEKAPLAFKGAVVRSTGGVLSLATDLVVTRPGTPKGRVYLLTDLSIAADGKLSAKLKTRETAGAQPVEIAATAAGVHLAAYSKANAAPWAAAGAYNFAFTKPTLLAGGGNPPPVPAGSGYARAPVTAEGRMTLKGKLPDGAPLTASILPGTDASFRLFARPYGAVNGAFLSSDFKLVLTSVKNGSGVSVNRYALAAGGGEDTFWQRPAGIAKPATYPAGFGPLGLTLQVQPWVFFNGTNLGLTFAANNGPVTLGVAFSGPTLANAAPNIRGLPTDLVINFKTLKFTDAALPDASRLTLKFVEKTGQFSGTLLLTDGGVSRTVAIEGIFLVPTNVNNTTLAGGTVTGEGLAIIPGLNGASPTTERIRLYQQGAAPATP